MTPPPDPEDGPRVDVAAEVEDGRGATPSEVAAEAERVLRALGLAAGTELSVLLVDGSRIHALNREWRDRDHPTDVLSFPQLEPGATPEGPLGDVVLNVDSIPRQAAEHGLTPAEELRFLLIHSILHLLGHDHHGADERATMEAEEQRLWGALGGAGRIR